jgi:hypothetical protein
MKAIPRGLMPYGWPIASQSVWSRRDTAQQAASYATRCKHNCNRKKLSNGKELCSCVGPVLSAFTAFACFDSTLNVVVHIVWRRRHLEWWLRLCKVSICHSLSSGRQLLPTNARLCCAVMVAAPSMTF